MGLGDQEGRAVGQFVTGESGRVSRGHLDLAVQRQVGGQRHSDRDQGDARVRELPCPEAGVRSQLSTDLGGRASRSGPGRRVRPVRTGELMAEAMTKTPRTTADDDVADPAGRYHGDRAGQQTDLERQADAPRHHAAVGVLPGHQRPHPHRQQEPERERNRQAVEEGLSHRDPVAAEGFDDDRVEGSRHDDEGVDGQQEVVEQEAALPAEERVEPGRLGDEMRAGGEEPERTHQDDEEESEEDRSERRLGERMDRGDGARPGEERSEDGRAKTR